MPLTFTENRSAGSKLNFNANARSRLASVVSIGAAFVTNTPSGNISATDVQNAINELDTEKQPLDSTLTALAAYNTNGLLAQTAADTFAGRTITAPAAGISVSNGDGVSGNPTLALANDLSALEALSSTGLAARTTTDTWAQRTITGTTNQITVTDGNGVSGNPTISLPSAITISGLMTAGGFIPSGSTVPSNGMYLPASNTLGWAINSAAELQLTASALSPTTSDGLALGTSSLPWADADFADGAVLRFNNAYTVTHSTGLLTFSATVSCANFYMSGTTPIHTFNETDASANEKLSRIYTNAGVIHFDLVNDSAGVVDWMTVTRSGNTPGAVTIHGTTVSSAYNNGALVVSGGVGVAKNIYSAEAVRSYSGTATPAAASAVAGFTMGSALVGLYWGTGSPGGTVTAPKGSLYIRTDATTTTTRLFINTDAGTTWANFTASA